MTSAPREAVILRDRSGGYYAVPRMVIERYLVPTEHTAALDALLRSEHASFPLVAELVIRGIVQLPAEFSPTS